MAYLFSTVERDALYERAPMNIACVEISNKPLASVDETIHNLQSAQRCKPPFVSPKSVPDPVLRTASTYYFSDLAGSACRLGVLVNSNMNTTPSTIWLHENGAYVDDLITWLESCPAVSVKPGAAVEGPQNISPTRKPLENRSTELLTGC